MRLPWPSGGRGRKKQNSRQLSEMCPRHSPGPAPIEEGGGGRDKGVSCCPRTLSCARVWGGRGTINLSSDDALDVLQISCRSRARSREGYSRGWAEAHPTPAPYRVAGQSHSARLLPFSPLSFPRKRESSAPTPVTRPGSRLRGNGGNREVGEPKLDCPARGRGCRCAADFVMAAVW